MSQVEAKPHFCQHAPRHRGRLWYSYTCPGYYRPHDDDYRSDIIAFVRLLFWIALVPVVLTQENRNGRPSSTLQSTATKSPPKDNGPSALITVFETPTITKDPTETISQPFCPVEMSTAWLQLKNDDDALRRELEAALAELEDEIALLTALLASRDENVIRAAEEGLQLIVDLFEQFE
ncbi:hypothetical protein F4808DRAFT_464184 [Astrocystis sublimbata]|nr:hypothetical protein F4808DRAFT_464184 [Astrocystis sublimbata]